MSIARVAWLALAVIRVMLAGCALEFDPPSAAEASLVAEGNKVIVRSLHCFPTGEVVASGVKDAFTGVEGVLFLSEDRGASWRRVALGAQAVGIGLSLLSMPGSLEGALYASGYREGASFLSGVITFRFEAGPWWVTRDKGRSWEHSEPRLPLLGTTVISEKLPTVVRADEAGTLVTVVEEQGRLAFLRSSDGGNSWSRQILGNLEQYGSLVSNGRGKLALTGRTIEHQYTAAYRSDDAGATWQQVRLPKEFDLLGALRLYRTPRGALIAYNNDEFHRSDYRSAISQSLDAGRTWGPVRNFPRLGRIVGIAGDAKGRVVAITSQGAVLLSTDDGGVWRMVHSTKRRTQSSNVILSNDGTVVATLDRGHFMRSSDGGETWQAVDSQLPDRQYGLDTHCTDGKGLIVVAGTGGMITRSTDWGATWQRGRLRPESGLGAAGVYASSVASARL